MYIVWSLVRFLVTRRFTRPQTMCYIFKNRKILYNDSVQLRSGSGYCFNLLKFSLFVCLFVLGFNVSLTLFQSYCDGTCIRQVIVLPHWNAPVAGTWQEHPTQSHYKLTPGRPAIFPSTHLSMPSVSKGATCTIFLRLLVCRGWGSNQQPSEPQANALPLHHPGRSVIMLRSILFTIYTTFYR